MQNDLLQFAQHLNKQAEGKKLQPWQEEVLRLVATAESWPFAGGR